MRTAILRGQKLRILKRSVKTQAREMVVYSLKLAGSEIQEFVRPKVNWNT